MAPGGTATEAAGHTLDLTTGDGASAKGDDTRQRLVAAAAEVFAEKGYERAGVQEIARRAGLTTGAIYSRFSGKAELLAEAIANESGEQLDLLFAAGGPSLDAAAVIRGAGVHLPGRPATRKQFLLLEAFVAARRDPELAEVLRVHLDEVRSTFARIVDLGRRSGDLDEALDTDAVVHFCQAVGLGFLLYEAIGAAAPDAPAWTGLIERLVDALRPEQPSTSDPSATETTDTGADAPPTQQGDPA